MVSNRIIKFRIDNGQYERLIADCQARGHNTVSSYMRYLAFERNYKYEMMIHEIYNTIKRQKTGS